MGVGGQGRHISTHLLTFCSCPQAPCLCIPPPLSSTKPMPQHPLLLPENPASQASFSEPWVTWEGLSLTSPLGTQPPRFSAPQVSLPPPRLKLTLRTDESKLHLEALSVCLPCLRCPPLACFLLCGRDHRNGVDEVPNGARHAGGVQDMQGSCHVPRVGRRLPSWRITGPGWERSCDGSQRMLGEPGGGGS